MNVIAVAAERMTRAEWEQLSLDEFKQLRAQLVERDAEIEKAKQQIHWLMAAKSDAKQAALLREALGKARHGLLFYHNAECVKDGIDSANTALAATEEKK